MSKQTDFLITFVMSMEAHLAKRDPLKLALVNLAVVAFLGLVMRIKILLPLPLLDQKFLLNGHSHFAFSAWISYVLFVLLIKNLGRGVYELPHIQRFFIWYNVNCWAMLVAFLSSGYSAVSLVFSAIHILQSWQFARYWLRYRLFAREAMFRAAGDRAVLFLILSTLGPGILMWMRLGHFGGYAVQNALYVYLHYQYNGWFLLGIMALWFASGSVHNRVVARRLIHAYTIAAFFGISLLLMMRDKPVWFVIYNHAVSVVLIACMVFLVQAVRQNREFVKALPKLSRVLWTMAFAGILLKTSLQALSAIPWVGYLMYVHRAVAIGYLHLVFLIICSFFIMGYLYYWFEAEMRHSLKPAISAFVAGVLLNEAILALQGFGAIFYFQTPWSNEVLVLASAIMCFAAIGIAFKTIRS